jgi:choline dehydrogenase-like flavoprotein
LGGAGIHWNGQTWRFLPTDFQLRSHLELRYGKDALPADMTIQDWPVSYDELEPYYDRRGAGHDAQSVLAAQSPDLDGGCAWRGFNSIPDLVRPPDAMSATAGDG